MTMLSFPCRMQQQALMWLTMTPILYHQIHQHYLGKLLWILFIDSWRFRLSLASRYSVQMYMYDYTVLVQQMIWGRDYYQYFLFKGIQFLSNDTLSSNGIRRIYSCTCRYNCSHCWHYSRWCFGLKS